MNSTQNTTQALPSLSETVPLPKINCEKDTSTSYMEYSDVKDKDLTKIIGESDSIEDLDEARFAAGLMSRPGLVSTKIKLEMPQL